MKESIKYIEDYILRLSKYINIKFIVYSPLVVAMSILVFGLEVGRYIYSGPPPEKLFGLLLGASFFVTGLSGIIQIMIKDIPGIIFPIRGKVAMVFGVIWITFFWLLAIIAVIGFASS